MHPENVLSLFVGTWSLLNISSTQNGIPNVDPGFGPHPVGLVLYHPDHHMMATLASTTPEDRPKNLTWPYHPTQGDHDWALVGKHSIAYTGQFRLNESVPVVETKRGLDGQIIHGPLEVATLPSFIGTYQRRDFSFVFQGEKRGGMGTLLSLSADIRAGNRVSVWWEKK